MASRIDAVDIKHINELRVYRGEHLVGILKRTALGCEFTFEETFLKNETYNELAYGIRKQPNPLVHQGVNLPPFFAGLLPEGLRLKTLVKELKTSEDDLFSLLAAIGEGSVGDVFTQSEGFNRPEPEIPDIKEIDFFQFFQDNNRSGLMAKGADSIAGVQEKISASMIRFPVHIAKKNTSYILKLSPKDKPNLTGNEYQCLQLAKKCGLEVNVARMVYDKNNNSGILIERFDRILETKINKIQMVHQEDACQFLNRYPADKYRLSYSEICEGIKALATAPLIELLKVLQLYVFCYLIGNGDLHGKNISLQTDVKSGRIQLTPAYDLICTRIYQDQSMALKLDGRDKNFRRNSFVAFGQRFGLENKAVIQMLDKVLSRLEKNKEMLLEIPCLNKKEQKLLSSMLSTRLAELS